MIIFICRSSNSINIFLAHLLAIKLFNFADKTRGESILDCLECTAGSYCEAYGLSEPTGLCDIGYFCPGGQATSQPTDLACSPGHFCFQGSWNQTGCPSGYYQPDWGQGDCDLCTPGSYCKAIGKLDFYIFLAGLYESTGIAIVM